MTAAYGFWDFAGDPVAETVKVMFAVAFAKPGYRRTRGGLSMLWKADKEPSVDAK